jgi:hypothetical protein
METLVYTVVYGGPGYGYSVVQRVPARSLFFPAVVASGPYATREQAQAEADRRNLHYGARTAWDAAGRDAQRAYGAAVERGGGG